MNRKEKIQLLRDIAAGNINPESLITLQAERLTVPELYLLLTISDTVRDGKAVTPDMCDCWNHYVAASNSRATPLITESEGPVFHALCYDKAKYWYQRIGLKSIYESKIIRRQD